MSPLLRLAAALVFVTTLVLGSSAAHAQSDTTLAPATSSTEVEATTTTADPLDTAPVLELQPGPGSTAPPATSDEGPNIGLLVAAIVLPLIGIAIVAWYWNRTKKAAAERARRSGPDGPGPNQAEPDRPGPDDSSVTG